MSGIFFAIVLIAFLVAAYRQVTGKVVPTEEGVQTPMEALSGAVVDAASGAVTGLTLDRSGGMLQLDWSPSCNADDDDYAIYEGAIGGQFDDHASKLCSTGGTTSESFSAPGGSAYYLVVPRNLIREGSYGRKVGGVERDPGAGACAPQTVGECL